jgi:hypothetical protein
MEKKEVIMSNFKGMANNQSYLINMITTEQVAI